ncbi:hypothetical protein AVEN_25269-1 [Araneus ventricosus]|uniref:Uncharacterized protein n=1 Tax=Araneus ventricosus TaxID=182803 RepID=A0A4Y2VF32_ARAVE|nr:hypothetical protein AVEN_25269-1 [Araneus ventricosus]
MPRLRSRRTKSKTKGTVYSAIMWAHFPKEWLWIFGTSSCNDKGQSVCTGIDGLFYQMARASHSDRPRLWLKELVRAWISRYGTYDITFGSRYKFLIPLSLQALQTLGIPEELERRRYILSPMA